MGFVLSICWYLTLFSMSIFSFSPLCLYRIYNLFHLGYFGFNYYIFNFQYPIIFAWFFVFDFWFLFHIASNLLYLRLFSISHYEIKLFFIVNVFCINVLPHNKTITNHSKTVIFKNSNHFIVPHVFCRPEI